MIYIYFFKGHFVELRHLESMGKDLLEGRWINERFTREARRVPLEAGSLIIWNSKCIHQGWSKGENRLPLIHNSLLT
jgi:hypothetical protein